ncbi:MaoC/PaaZ C-terminal domain-containing protein [Halegenticoccus soli]|uniref:MaoC/PaaZ C-terminal domain-containing protein n=1 Tax=Halegenticoccus soli TaxID=1985678 RepID=UPI000C6DC7B1
MAHGALAFSTLTGLAWRARGTSDDVVAFYGVDRLRFRAPVFVGDTLPAELTATEKTPRDHPTASGVVRYEAELTRADGTAVRSCELLSLLR